MKEPKQTTFKDLTWPLKLGVIGGICYFAEFAIYFIWGVIIGLGG